MPTYLSDVLTKINPDILLSQLFSYQTKHKNVNLIYDSVNKVAHEY